MEQAKSNAFNITTGWAKKVTLFVQCLIISRGITFWPTLYTLSLYCLYIMSPAP